MENEIKNKVDAMFNDYDMGFITELEMLCNIRSLMDEEITKYLAEIETPDCSPAGERM